MARKGESRDQKRRRKKKARGRAPNRSGAVRAPASASSSDVARLLRQGQDGTDPSGSRTVHARGFKFQYTYGPKLDKGDMHQLSITGSESVKAEFMEAVQAELCMPSSADAFMQFTDVSTVPRGKRMTWRWFSKRKSDTVH